MIIKNVKVFTEDNIFKDGNIYIENGVFAQPSGECGETIDGAGCYAVPGFIDLHFHGCKGYDICDGTRQALEKIADYQASVGVTTIAPATMTLPVEQLEQILGTAASYADEAAGGADLVGINMEGPFISKVKKGAQDETHIIPCDREVFNRLQSAAKGLVKFIGVAPEEEGALEFIDQVKGEISVSLAHTNADYDTAKEAFDRGASHAVHLFNAMPAFTHRAPGVVGAVSDSSHVMAELICDGIHVHPSMVRAAFKMLGPERIIFISDSMRAAGMPDGSYTLGGLDVYVTGKRAVLASDGALAGSVTNLADCVRTAVKEMGIPLETAIGCATANPAKSLGLFDRFGSIAPGKAGNVVLLDEKLNLKAVIRDGKIYGEELH